MSDRPASGDACRDGAWVIAAGVLLAVGMTSLSLTGLLGRLTTVSVAACLLLAAVAGAIHARRSGASGIRGRLWVALPFLVPSALAAVFLPPYSWDEVAYGAALPRDFARAGRFFYNADYGPYSAFPANYEALVTASLVLTGDVAFAQLLNVALALGMAAIAALLARALGASKSAQLLAGLFVLCAPVLIQVAPRTKNDVANAFLQALAVLVLVVCVDRPGLAAAAFSGAFLGASLGTKYSSLHFVLAIAPFSVLLLTQTSASRRSACERVLTWVASLVVFASPWYARNLALFGNPVFPFLNDVLGLQNGLTPEQSVLMQEGIDSLSDFSFKTGTVATFASRMATGLGVLPAVLMWPGALLALRPPHRRTGVLLGGTAVAYTGVTLFAGYWEPRYVLSLLVIAGPLAALALTSLGSAVGRIRVRAGWLAPALLLVPAAIAIRGAYPLWAEHWHNVSAIRHEGRQAFIENRVAYHAVASWLNTHMSRDDRVAIGFNIQPFYYLEGSYYHIHPLTEGDFVAAETPEQVEAALRRVGATLLAFSGSDGTHFEDTAPKITGFRERMWQAQRQLRKAGRLSLLATVNGVRILRLEATRPPPDPTPSPEPRDR